jgi:hypothetical protein
VTKNALIKLIVKKLATAPALALDAVLSECTTEEEREEARRIFSAVGVKNGGKKWQ